MSRLSLFRSLLLSVALAFMAMLALAQEMLQLGSLTYARAEAPHLRMPVSTAPRFFRRVGGVAFSAVADGIDGLAVTELRYEAGAPDGNRLVVSLQRGEQRYQVRAPLFDWELIPIARFAKDENGSAMTLFGQLQDKEKQKELVERRARIINYHPALDNTLVGQRLFQADILIIQPNAVHVFRDSRGQILGAGETGHDPERNMVAYRKVALWQEEQRAKGQIYQSYVVGDLGQRVSFDVQGSRLVFAGRPHWAAWKSRLSQQEMRARADAAEGGLGKKLEELVARYNAAVDSARARAASMSSAEQRQVVEALERRKGEIESLERQLEAEMESISAVEQMPEYSAQLSAKIASVDGINPLVYSAVTKVMHYRSLFKHFQRRDAAAFSRFVHSVASVEPAPRVITPTVQHAQ